MTENPFHIAELITAHLQGTLSDQQRFELDQWLQLPANRKFLEEFTDLDNFGDRVEQFAAANAETTWDKTLIRLKENSQITPCANEKAVSEFKLYNYQWVARAAAIAVICLGIYFFNPFTNHSTKPSGESRNLVINDVAPGTQGATLTLAKGKKIELTGNKNAVIANASKIIYDDGTLVDSSTVYPNADVMLRLETANGKTYSIILPDGTKVRLNAASSITFPSSFTGKRREVKITGEAYLEVFKDHAHPFVVVSRDQQLEVLGTHFNIRSYPEEQGTKTTLLEGSVKLNPLSPNANSGVVLKPNEQSITEAGTIKVQPANIGTETAWIKNDFYFRGETLEKVLRDVARWYNVKISYSNEGVKSIPLIGQISRTRPLSAVLERIASAGNTRFKIEGKQVTVMPDLK